MECNNFEPRVKYSSNPNQSYAIVSTHNQAKLYFLPEYTPIKITNPSNNAFTICNILYDPNVKSDSIYLSTQTIQTLRIKMFKKIKFEPMYNEIPNLSVIVLKPLDTLDYNNANNANNAFSDEKLQNFINPYFESNTNKIYTIGDILIMNSHGNKVKFIVSMLVNLDKKYSISGCVNSNTICHYGNEPFKSINDFYESNQFISYNKDTKKFKLIYNFSKPINLSEQEQNKDVTNGLYHYIKVFTIFSGLLSLYLFIIRIINNSSS